MTKSQPSRDTFLDRWGHWVLWMGPYILIVSLLAWTPRLALCLCAVELIQFTQHVRAEHPTHPITSISALFVALSWAMIVVGILLFPFSGWVYVLVFCQMTFSVAVHDHFHGRSLGLPALIGFGGASVFWWGIFLTMQGVVPGLPLLRPYLISG